MKHCPYCAEEIQDGAVKCKHCGSMLAGTCTDTLGNTPTERNQHQSTLCDTIGQAKTIFGGELYDNKLLAGQYRIVGSEPLGSGGMGEVWKAIDTELGTTVAIKVLPPVMARDKAAIENLKREAMIGQQLTHPNICRLYGFHSEGKLKFIVMEFIDGQTLKELLSQRDDRKLNWEELEPIASQVAEALDYAHNATYKDAYGRPVKGVLHRDIKPANIMITKDGQTKLMDFGIAREIHNTMTQLTGRTSSLTPMYASPEQFRGEKMTPASDIYSFTAVLYECLAGHSYISPHGDQAYQILQREFEPLVSQSQTLNKAMEAGLSGDQNNRPKTANELIGLLRTKPKLRPRIDEKIAPEISVEKEVVSVKPPPVQPEVIALEIHKARPSAGRKGVWIALGVIITVIIVAAIVNWSGRPKDRPGRPSNVPQTVRTEPKPPDSQVKSPAKIQETITSTQDKLQPKAGDVITNTIGMKLVYIPPGEFMMGSPANEEGRDSDEGSQHRVKISKGFYMGVTEVTQQQYQAVMRTNPSNFKGDNLPVEQVSWNDAVEFCNKLSQQEGKNYRLPSEAEWEYACRAGSTGRFYFGDTDSSLGEYAWYDGNSGNKTHPVGQKKPNAFGLYDMMGNVWEWCSDWYGKDYYSINPGDDPKGPSTGSARVLRGGSWYFVTWCCRSADRYWDSPGLRGLSIGFRVVVLDF